MGASAKVLILGNDLNQRAIGNAVKAALDAATRQFHRTVIEESGCFNLPQYNNQNPDKRISTFTTITGYDFNNLYINLTYKLVNRKIQMFAPFNYNDYKELDEAANSSISFSMGAGAMHTQEIIDVIRETVKDYGKVFYTYDDSAFGHEYSQQ